MSPQPAWFHRFPHEQLGRVARRERCARLSLLLSSGGARASDVRRDLDRVIHSTSGRFLSPFVMGDHPRWQSLTDFFDRGAAHAASLLPHMKSDDVVLEYGGGLGRIGHAIAPHVRRLISVDVDPMAEQYGPRLSPGVEFSRRDAVPASPDFDGAYAVDGLRHVGPDGLADALEYVHDRLKPGGWVLVDLAATGAELERFRVVSEPLFCARRVPLANAGFLLHKTAGASDPTWAPADGRYAVNDGPVVADVLEGEVVVVNLDTGAYYILQGTASAIWQMLAAGRAVPDVVEAFSRRYPDQAHAMAQVVTEFVGQLVEEKLLVPEATPGLVSDSDIGPGLGAGLPDDRPFEAPVMFRYTDMQALIQMDPIREFDETGWPVRRQPASAARKE